LSIAVPAKGAKQVNKINVRPKARAKRSSKDLIFMIIKLVTPILIKKSE
jgi:hypothetical protein